MKTTFVALSLACFFLASCTQQQVAKQWGGTAKVDLPTGKKLVTVSWESTHLWYLLRDAKPGEKPETLPLKESSSFGLMQGEHRWTICVNRT